MASPTLRSSVFSSSTDSIIVWGRMASGGRAQRSPPHSARRSPAREKPPVSRGLRPGDAITGAAIPHDKACHRVRHPPQGGNRVGQSAISLSVEFGLTSNNLVAILPIKATILLLLRFSRFKPFFIKEVTGDDTDSRGRSSRA